MSSLKQKIEQDVKEAMKQKDVLSLSVLRMFLSALHNRVIDKKTKGLGEELTEEEVVAAMHSEVKKRRDSIQEFARGNRQDLVEKETAEMIILEKYLPAELSDEDLEKITSAVIGKLGDVTASPFDKTQGRDFGRVMGLVMKETKGQASGDRVSKVVNKFLQK